MKRVILPVAVSLILGALVSCKSSKVATDATMMNSKATVSWDGTYAGELPDSQTTLTLGKDQMYKTTITPAGQTQGKDYVGKFEWNAEGSMITLGPPYVGGEPSSYLVQNNILTKIDKDGRVVTGKGHRSGYVLAKK